MVTRPNYLAAQAWGARPKSAKRRRRALRAWLTPSVLYLSILAMVACVSWLASFSDDPADRLKQTFEPVFFAGWWLGAVFCACLPLRLESGFGNGDQLQANRHDYRLAGITGLEMLKGLAAPQLAGMKLFFRIYASILLTGSAIMAIFLLSSNIEAFFYLLIALIGSFGTSMYNLFLGSRYYLSQWALTPNKASRKIKAALFIFSCPITACTFFPPLVLLSFFLILAELVSLAVRSSIMADAWTKAQTELDGNPEIIPIADDE